MIYFSSPLTTTSLCNFANHLAKEAPHRLQEAGGILTMLPLTKRAPATITLANVLLMQGRKEKAQLLIEELEWHDITSPEQLSALGMTYNRLGSFKVANKIFAFAEDRGLCCPNFYTHKAIAHICLSQPRQAEKCINQDIGRYGPSILNLYWKMRFLNSMGRHEDALLIAEELIADYSSSSPNHLCFVFVEQGIALRFSGHPLKGLVSFNNAIAVRDASPPWLWIAHFENALTLALSGKIEMAMDIAAKGHRINFSTMHSPYNPCSILHEFLCQKYGGKTSPPSLEMWIKFAKRWPWPFLPYHLWIFLFTALTLSIDHHQLGIEKKQCERMTNEIAAAFSLLLKNSATEINITGRQGHHQNLDKLVLAAFSHLYGRSTCLDVFRSKPDTNSYCA